MKENSKNFYLKCKVFHSLFNSHFLVQTISFNIILLAIFMFRYHTLNDFNLKNKTVGVRVDINSPIINNKIQLNKRIVEHSKTIEELSNKGAKVVILAHQGRKGKDDCISLSSHAKLIEKEIKKKVQFIDEIYSKKVEDKINKLKDGDILVLENLRFIDDELDLKKKDNKILKLETLFDYYVIDAFSVAHREQTSMVGFKKIPLMAGRVMEAELKGLNNIESVKRPSVYCLGGAKPDDLIKILEINFKRGLIDYACLSGVIGEIALMMKGYNLGCKKKFLEEKGYLDSKTQIAKLIQTYDDKIILPKDLAIFDGKKRVEIKLDELNSKKNKDLIEKYMIADVGKDTIKYFKSFINLAGSVYFKGPAGNFEDKNFIEGSKNLIQTIAKSKAFSYMGGGHSVTAIEQFANISDFSYISLAGGALVKFLSGETLPGVQVLEDSFSKSDKEHQDFIVIGSNTLDIDINSPIMLKDFHLGDKVRVEEDFKQSIGGGGVNVSICISRLGGEVGYLGKISQENEQQIKDVLDRDKVGLIKTKLSKIPCAKSILVDTPDEDRIIFTYRGQNSDLRISDVNLDDLKASNYYFTSLAGYSFKTQVAIAKHVKSTNQQNKTCLNLSFNLIRNEKNLDALVKNMDILVLNYEEAQEYVKKDDLTDLLKTIKKKCEVVVITDGSRGAYAYDGNEEYFVKAFKPKRILDTTGAGDCFAGTFFYFYSKGFGIKKALEMGVKNSASVIAYKGAQDGLLYFDDLNKK